MPGGRPSKPLALVQGHRTKAEKKVREKAESELLSGNPFKESPEVKSDSVAHKEFIRLKKVYKAIGKDDALHEAAINRYCLLHSECAKLQDKIKYLDIVEDLNEYIILDKQLMTKRKAMLDIEKENLLTIQSALRSIPKKPEEKKGSPMADFLKRKNNAT